MTKRTPDDVAKYILGCCTCHDAYKARDLVDPDCAWCEYGGCVVALAEQVAAYETALRAWDEWRRTCCDEVDGVASWTAALRLTTKALEVKPCE